MDTVFKRIEAIGEYQHKHATLTNGDVSNLTENWQYQIQDANERLFDLEGKPKKAILENFRRHGLFIGDNGPYTDYANWKPKYWYKVFLNNPVYGTKQFLREKLGGLSRGEKKSLIERYHILERENAIPLLKKYPVSKTPGNPFIFHYKGCEYNARWARHIYLINLIHKHLKIHIEKYTDFINLDLGCGYGSFPYLFKSEYPNTKHVLVDFPDQLILVAYFLSTAMPSAKIATILDYSDRDRIDREFINKYDFVLIPVSLYEKIESGSIDMLTNFVSLGEMKPEWFNFYLKGKLFETSSYFFTCNRFVSGPRFEPTHNTSITIMDYPLDQFETLLFDINPLFIYNIQQKYKFFYEKKPMSSYQFEFIGKRL